MASPQLVGILTIANGQQLSNELTRNETGRSRSLVLVSQDAALTGVVTLQTAGISAVFATIQSPAGTDIALAAAKAVVVLASPFNRIRLSSTLAEGGARSWEVWGAVGE